MTIPHSERARQIAEKLTKAQRAMVGGPLYSAVHFGIAAAWFHDASWQPGRALKHLGLGERRVVRGETVAIIPNELGLSVRQILQESSEQ